MSLLTWIFFVTGATAALFLILAALIVFLDGWHNRRDARRRNMAHRL